MNNVKPILIIILSTLISIATAHNITLILGRYPVFSQFNDLLTKNDLAKEINSRGSVTVLALTNDRIGDLASKPEEVQKRILSVNIILDYWDREKLMGLKTAQRTMLTNLYQASGFADDKQGFIDIVHEKNDTIAFSTTGGPLNTQLEGSVASIPYNISVLSVSQPIIAPGIDGSYPMAAPPPKNSSTAPPPPKSPTAPPPAEEVTPPAESPREVVADAPTPAANTPAEADVPNADAPAADSPDAADVVAQPPTKSKSNNAGKHTISGVSFGFTVMLLVSFLAFC